MNWIETMPGYRPIEYHPTPEEGLVQSISVERAVAEMERNTAAGESSMLLATCAYQLRDAMGEMGKAGVLFSNRYRASCAEWNPHTPSNGRSAFSHLLSWTRPFDLDEILPEDAVSIAKRLRARTFKHKIPGQKALVTFCETAEAREPAALIRKLVTSLEPSTWDALNRGDLEFYRRELLAKQSKGIEEAIALYKRWGRKGEDLIKLTTVGTIHSVKGGQADHVYLMCDLSPKGWQQWNDVDLRHALYRLFYVGATRARKTLSIIHPQGRLHINMAKHWEVAA